jgi:hypothetical protein
MYAITPEKPPSLVGRNYCLAIPLLFVKAILLGFMEKWVTKYLVPLLLLVLIITLFFEKLSTDSVRRLYFVVSVV